MNHIGRRTFVQLSTGALLSAASRRLVASSKASIAAAPDGSITVEAANYGWKYEAASDTFRLIDARKRLIVSGKLQPAIVVSSGDEKTERRWRPGKAARPRVEPGRIVFEYEGVNGSSRVATAWRFDEDGIWTEPIVYESTASEDVISLHYFLEEGGARGIPSLDTAYVIAPGMLSGSAISPIVSRSEHLDESFWLGRGSFIRGLSQQWGLPVHYFCGFNMNETDGQRDRLTEGRSDAFACGLADLPNGDMFMQLDEGKSSIWIDYRSDLWKHLRGPGKMTLGATLYWAVAPDYYQAIAAYYKGLLEAGIIHSKQSSERKTAAALTPQFCTWGVQVDRNKGGERLNEAFLREIYAELKASGMKAGLFSIDDKWEGSYGKLMHSEERFPHFEQFLDELRRDGYRIGMWAALMRCERPADLGLSEDNMLKRPDGKPYVTEFASSRYYILDFTQPVVAKKLAEVARQFVRRYKPDLLKFDFGYELPAAGIAAPADKEWCGERLMLKGLQVAITAMREEKPDLVVMYYNLSPLFLEFFDLHSPDDLYMCPGEYDVEANRRFYFSSLLGPLGVPTYGSSGYDWASSPNIWFDSAAMGTLGCLNDFAGDEQGERSTPERVARYNGLLQTLRKAAVFEIVPMDTVMEAPTLGAHARSWARFEQGQLVLLAYRPSLPGEDNPLSASSRSDARVQGLIECSMPVVIASRTSESIDSSESLALVPCASGDISVRCRAAKQAQVRHHYFGGGVSEELSPIEGGRLRLASKDHNGAGQPLEWIEVLFS